MWKNKILLKSIKSKHNQMIKKIYKKLKLSLYFLKMKSNKKLNCLIANKNKL